jgi:hypothetical protein
MYGKDTSDDVRRAVERVDRDMDRFRQKRRRRSIILAIERGASIHPSFGTVVDFPCFHLCGTCGFLERSPVGSCPSCRSDNWLNLADEVVAASVRDMESSARQKSPTWVKLALGSVPAVLTAGAAVTGAAVFGGALSASVLLGALGAGASIPVYLGLLRPFTVFMMRFSR